MAKKEKMPSQVPNNNLEWLENLIEFAKSNQVFLTVIFVVILLGAIGLSVFSQMKKNEAEESNKLYDIAMSQVQMMVNTEDEAQRQQLFQQHVAGLDQLIQTYPNTVAAVRARLYMGKIYFSEAYSTQNAQAIVMALQYYQQARDTAKSDFFRALGTIGMAYCYEQQNDYAKAFASFQDVVNNYPKEGFNPVCLVGMARAKEMVNDVAGALVYYNQVVSQYPDSIWARFAHGKIYFYGGTASNLPQPAVPSLPLGGTPPLP